MGENTVGIGERASNLKYKVYTQTELDESPFKPQLLRLLANNFKVTPETIEANMKARQEGEVAYYAVGKDEKNQVLSVAEAVYAEKWGPRAVPNVARLSNIVSHPDHLQAEGGVDHGAVTELLKSLRDRYPETNLLILAELTEAEVGLGLEELIRQESTTVFKETKDADGRIDTVLAPMRLLVLDREHSNLHLQAHSQLEPADNGTRRTRVVHRDLVVEPLPDVETVQRHGGQLNKVRDDEMAAVFVGPPTVDLEEVMQQVLPGREIPLTEDVTRIAFAVRS